MQLDTEEHLNQKRFIYNLVTGVIFVVILFRFFYIQVVGSEEHFISSEANRTREIELVPTRGLMFDRDQHLIIDNVPSYSVSVIPYELKNKEFLFDLVSQHFPEELEQVKEKIEKAPTRYKPVKILKVDHSGLTYFEENRIDLPGVISQPEPRRNYPSDIRASHFLGYIKEINEDEIKALGENLYKSGDIVGKSGLELYYEDKLRGRKGYKYMEVDALGRELGEFQTSNSTAPVPGDNLILTLDKDLQKLSEDLLGDSLGAVIALNPQNGEIYAAVSKPDFEPSFMSSHFTQDEFDKVLNQPGHPLFNRVTQSTFPPGSTYKIVSAIAALSEGIITPDQTFTCTGSFRLGRKVYYCWKQEGHGTLNVIQAIERSCNVFFYNVSQKMTIDQWSRYGRLFRFGIPTGVDIPEESQGVLPTREYMEEKYKDTGWVEKGQMINLIIGQGDLLVTPLQMVQFAATMGTKGRIVQPHFLRAAVDSKTGEKVFEPRVATSYIENIDERVWETTRLGMYNVVNGDRGTARSVRLPGIKIAGKTGTAQNPHGQEHSWFIGFAPFENPTIAVAVFVEQGGSGGRVAAPIAREIFREYFRKKTRRENILSGGVKH